MEFYHPLLYKASFSFGLEKSIANQDMLPSRAYISIA
jgi:hypothetical protein